MYFGKKHNTEVKYAFNGHKFELSCICTSITVFMAVVLLKTRIHDTSVGDYSPYTIYIFLTIYSTSSKLLHQASQTGLS